MYELKEMPYSEKFTAILGYTKMVEDFAPKLVKKELGEEKVDELQTTWEKGIEQISETASDKDKYETAYKNFMWKWVSANNLMDTYQGEHGKNKYMEAAISAWKRKYIYAFAVEFVGSLSRKTAFRILAKRLAYQLQAFSPFSVTELKDNRMVLAVTPCKILTDQNGSSFCSMACQNIIPSWLEAEFNIKMNPDRHGANCKVIFEPFSS
ncbi:TPA: hypothetical protein HA274_04405 [Candidatus Bathyarchaeota archaeon]|nr:hypothetical protein [Candidatus Bathyarchaeota archaeon]